MGFFGRLFKRKGGGTRVGNWLRQKAFNYTDGIFGENVAILTQEQKNALINPGEGAWVDDVIKGPQ